MSGMDDLIAFYRARLDEDERVARTATDGTWEVIGSDRPYPAYPGEQVIEGRGWSVVLKEPRIGDVASELLRGDAEHIVRYDPARVLREVEAKRRILKDCEEAIDESEQYRRETGDKMITRWGRLHAEQVLRLLALPYADHHDYREEWKP